IEVELFEVRSRGEIEEERAFLLLWTSATALVMALETQTFGHLRRVKLPLARRHHGYRNRRQPPVRQIEMMRRLVNHEAAGVFLVTVPAPEIIRAVLRVEQPVKVHRKDVANHPAHQEIFDLSAMG